MVVINDSGSRDVITPIGTDGNSQFAGLPNYDSWGAPTSSSTPSQINTDTNVTNPESQMTGNVIGGVAQSASSLIGAGFQYNNLQNQQREARSLYQQSAADELRQHNVSNSIKQKTLEQQEQRESMDEQAKTFDSRMKRWLYNFKKRLEKQAQFRDSIRAFAAKANENEDYKNMAMKLWS